MLQVPHQGPVIIDYLIKQEMVKDMNHGAL